MMFKSSKQKDIFVAVYALVWIVANCICDAVFGTYLWSNLILLAILTVVVAIDYNERHR